MKKEKDQDIDDMPAEIDFDYSKAEWGKHAKRYQEEGTNVVLLDAEVYDVFRDSASVNEALKQVIALSKLTLRPRPAPRRTRTGKALAGPVKK